MAVVSPSCQLSDEQWRQIVDLLPANGQRDGQENDHQLMIDAILWILSDGGRWRNMPERLEAPVRKLNFLRNRLYAWTMSLCCRSILRAVVQKGQWIDFNLDASDLND